MYLQTNLLCELLAHISFTYINVRENGVFLSLFSKLENHNFQFRQQFFSFWFQKGCGSDKMLGLLQKLS
jgi:hypothetical protein